MLQVKNYGEILKKEFVIDFHVLLLQRKMVLDEIRGEMTANKWTNKIQSIPFYPCQSSNRYLSGLSMLKVAILLSSFRFKVILHLGLRSIL